MRAKVKLHLKIMRWPLVLLFYAAVLLCIRNPIHGEFIPLGLTRDEVRGEVDYIAFSRWLLMMAVPVLVNGWYLERVSGIESGIPAGYMVLMSVFMGLVLIAVTSPPPLNFGKGVQTNGNHHNK